MVITNNYTLIEKKNRYCVHTNEEQYCPVCQAKMRFIGTRQRNINETDGSKKTLMVRRFYCFPCDSIHHELPDIVVPYKRHSAKSYETVINEESDDIPIEMENSTANRIKDW